MREVLNMPLGTEAQYEVYETKYFFCRFVPYLVVTRQYVYLDDEIVISHILRSSVVTYSTFLCSSTFIEKTAS
jgi:hypothetical protein